MSDIIPDTSTNALVDELKQRGVPFPIGGFSPGRYNVVCRSCARRFDGDKRSHQCLPCALVKSLAADKDVEAARKEGLEAGYRLAVDDVLAATGRRAKPAQVEIRSGGGEDESGTGDGATLFPQPKKPMTKLLP